MWVERAWSNPNGPGRAIIVLLRSQTETVTVPVGVIERTGVFLKEASEEVVESTEAADAEGGSWVTSVMGSSLVSPGVMSNDPLGDCVE